MAKLDKAANGTITFQVNDVIQAIVLEREIEGTKVRPSSFTAAIATTAGTGATITPELVLLYSSPKGGFSQLPFTVVTAGAYKVNDAVASVIISNR